MKVTTTQPALAPEQLARTEGKTAVTGTEKTRPEPGVTAIAAGAPDAPAAKAEQRPKPEGGIREKLSSLSGGAFGCLLGLAIGAAALAPGSAQAQEAWAWGGGHHHHQPRHVRTCQPAVWGQPVVVGHRHVVVTQPQVVVVHQPPVVVHQPPVVVHQPPVVMPYPGDVVYPPVVMPYPSPGCSPPVVVTQPVIVNPTPHVHVNSTAGKVLTGIGILVDALQK